MAGEIFISYRRVDQAKAKLLHDLLKQRGVDAWYDALLDAGDDWRHKTAHALVTAPIFVLLFSKAAAESDDISKELAAATFQKKTVIPVRIEDIHPEGAFLYELASRNWFDAFNNTEERLALLADRLAALVKGKPEEAKAAAEKLGAQGPARRGRAGRLRGASRGGFRPWMIFAGFGMLIGLVSVVGGLLRQPPVQAPAVHNERTAFFGFTAAGADPLVTEIAGNATEETFTALSSAQVETAARGDTLRIELDAQLDKARALGARYALGGEVRSNAGPGGDQIAVTIRLDDADTRATLWQETLTGSAAQRESLPVLAAGRVGAVLQCLITVRPDMVREDAAALAIVIRACQFPDFFDRQWVALWRDVAQVAPRSAAATGNIGAGLFAQTARASDAERPALLQEARASVQRGLAIRPDPGQASLAALMDINSDRPLADIVSDVNAAFQAADAGGERFTMSTMAAVRMLVFSDFGRYAEAARVGRSDAAAYPLTTIVLQQYAFARWFSGQKQEAVRVLDTAIRRFADAQSWETRATIAVAEHEDFAPILAAAPPTVPAGTVACWRDVAEATRAPNAAARTAGAGRLLACLRAGSFSPTYALVPLNLLGQVDAAFDIAGRAIKRSNPFGLVIAAPPLFSPATRPMRADPRFLPLVKQVGIYQYWLDTNTQPDVCDTPEERDFELCRELRKDQARP